MRQDLRQYLAAGDLLRSVVEPPRRLEPLLGGRLGVRELAELDEQQRQIREIEWRPRRGCAAHVRERRLEGSRRLAVVPHRGVRHRQVVHGGQLELPVLRLRQ